MNKKTLAEHQKNEILNNCQPLIEHCKEIHIQKESDKRFNYLIDIYLKWNRNYLYFCSKYKSEHPDRIADEFEEKTVRLEYIGNNGFNFSYMRHTGQWSLVACSLTLADCLEMIRDIPTFQPNG